MTLKDNYNVTTPNGIKIDHALPWRSATSFAQIVSSN